MGGRLVDPAGEQPPGRAGGARQGGRRGADGWRGRRVRRPVGAVLARRERFLAGAVDALLRDGRDTLRARPEARLFVEGVRPGMRRRPGALRATAVSLAG